MGRSASSPMIVIVSINCSTAKTAAAMPSHRGRGIGTWLAANTVAPEALVPPNLVGFFASIIGMLLGSLAPQLIGNKGHSIEAALKADPAETSRIAQSISRWPKSSPRSKQPVS